MNFKKELVKNILFKGINVLLSFAITVLMIRLLGAEGNGFYSLFIANTAIITLVVSFSFNSGLIFYSAKKEFSPGALFNTVILVLIIQALLVLVSEKLFKAIFGFSFYVDLNFPGLAFWGCLYLTALLLNGYLAAFFTGYKWFDTLNILTLVGNFTFLIVFAFMLFNNHSEGFSHSVFVMKTYILLVVFQAVLSL